MSTTRKDDDSDDTGFETSSELSQGEDFPVSQGEDFPPSAGYGPPRRSLRLPLLVFAVAALVAVLLIVYLLTR
jgi:hypothetical protein